MTKQEYKNYLKQWREQASMTQQQLADELGISRQSLHSLEKGKCLPSFGLSVLIEDFFNQPIRQIFNHSERTKFKKHFSDFSDMKNELGKVVQDGFNQAFGGFPAINVYTKNQQVIVEAEVPGMLEKDLKIDVTQDTVQISGKKQEIREIRKDNYFRRESSFGSFNRIIALPTLVDNGKAQAKMKNGQLLITVPISKNIQLKPKRLNINKEK